MEKREEAEGSLYGTLQTTVNIFVKQLKIFIQNIVIMISTVLSYTENYNKYKMYVTSLLKAPALLFVGVSTRLLN